jgi:hypothetical protein
MRPFELIELVVFLCSKYRGSISSWGRTFKHNMDVGGVPNSYHQLWMGVDIILDEMVKNDSFEADAKKLGLDPILEGDHYHLQPLGWR